MSFDLERFRHAALAPRQATVPVPELAFFFPEGADPVWVVRGLTGEELARANQVNERSGLISAAVQALANAAAAKSGQVEALQTLIGYGTDVPIDLAKRFDYLTWCSVDPVIDRDMAVRLFAAFPVVAYKLSNKVLHLTDEGPDVGKSPPSTVTHELSPP